MIANDILNNLTPFLELWFTRSKDLEVVRMAAGDPSEVSLNDLLKTARENTKLIEDHGARTSQQYKVHSVFL